MFRRIFHVSTLIDIIFRLEFSYFEFLRTYVFDLVDQRSEQSYKQREVAHSLYDIEYRAAGIYYGKSFPEVFVKSAEKSRVDQRRQHAERHRHHARDQSKYGAVSHVVFAEQRKYEGKRGPIYRISQHPGIESPYQALDPDKKIYRRYSRPSEYVSVSRAEKRDDLHVGDISQR